MVQRSHSMSKALNSIPNLEEENGKLEMWFWKSTKAQVAWAHLLEPSEWDTVMWACWAKGCFSKLAIFVYWPEGLSHRDGRKLWPIVSFLCWRTGCSLTVGSFSAKQKSRGTSVLRRLCHCQISPLGESGSTQLSSTSFTCHSVCPGEHTVVLPHCCISRDVSLPLWVSGDSGY